MAYRNKITGQIGNLKALLWNISSPHLLTEEELLELNIEYYEEPVVESSLEDIKKEKITEIKNGFEHITNNGFECSNGIKIDIREKDKPNWIIALQSGQDQTIRDFYNQTHNVTAQEFAIMFSEAMAYYKSQLTRKWELEDIVNNATTKEEVEAAWFVRPIFDETGLNIISYEYNVGE